MGFFLSLQILLLLHVMGWHCKNVVGLGKVSACFVFLQYSEASQIWGQKQRLDCENNNMAIMYLSMRLAFGVWCSDLPDTEIVRFLFPIFSLLTQLLCICWRKENNTPDGICFLITPRTQISHRNFIETCGHSLSSSKSQKNFLLFIFGWENNYVLPLYICFLCLLLKFYLILFVYEYVCVYAYAYIHTQTYVIFI